VSAKSSEAHTRRPQRAAHLSSNCGASGGASRVPARRASVLYTSVQVGTIRHCAVATRAAYRHTKGSVEGQDTQCRHTCGVRAAHAAASRSSWNVSRAEVLAARPLCWLVDRRRQRTLNTLGYGPGWSDGLVELLDARAVGCETGQGTRQALTMAKAKKVSVADTRKPKHPLDANRPSKGGKNQRDAATVGAQTCLSSRGAAVRGRPGRRGPSAAGARRAGAAAQHVQEDGDARQAREDPAPGAPRSACPAMPAPVAAQRVPDVAHPRSQDLQSKELPNTRIQPNRGWFQNSRVTDQKALERFREEMSTKARSYGALAPGGAGLPGGQCESTCRLVQELWSVPQRACSAWFRSCGLYPSAPAAHLQGPQRCPPPRAAAQRRR